MMEDFDYQSAWKELAEPGFHTLPQNIRDLYERVCVEAAALSQVSDLTMPWPEDSDLRERFDEVPAEVLAAAARIVYFFGHWSPFQDSGKGGGGTWKFSHYADQSLRGRAGVRIMDRSPSGNGRSMALIEGCIRVTLSTPGSWTWDEVGLGTAATVEAIGRAGYPPYSSTWIRQKQDEWVDACSEVTKRLKTEIWPKEREIIAAFGNTERFMKERCDECRSSWPIGTVSRKKLGEPCGECGHQKDLGRENVPCEKCGGSGYSRLTECRSLGGWPDVSGPTEAAAVGKLFRGRSR